MEKETKKFESANFIKLSEPKVFLIKDKTSTFYAWFKHPELNIWGNGNKSWFYDSSKNKLIHPEKIDSYVHFKLSYKKKAISGGTDYAKLKADSSTLDKELKFKLDKED